MGSVTPKARNIEITAESLREDLARLEVQKQALERELSAVTAHLDSVQRALSALQALMPMAAASSAAPGSVDVGPAAEPAPEGADASRARTDHADVEAEADSAPKYGKLTEQILTYFAEVADTDVRARDVAAALGRDTDSGSINAVRSTLDRLVGSSRIRRVGRGLYRAAKP
ncbi:hypothetical protein C3492_14625 [Streptomyces sp. Ru62]|uniref:hypothetical protein n=1 Tax=Streptomyces sp. Ru62 TaxID=2080745 RepID=UPI000CDE1524|nr:hypothetical protein [Streptomyces sp. Ru62]POX62901.1 hypothetical protein C3492_14625 [Streptomyces sp. Ru62]